MKYKHIVFDIDGTLIDTEYAVINSLIKTITVVRLSVIVVILSVIAVRFFAAIYH